MIYVLLGVTFVVGIFIHMVVTYLPTVLHRSWARECVAYLHNIQPSKINHLVTDDTSLPKIKWWRCLPFFSVQFLILDSVLFISSFFILYHFDGYLYWGSALVFTWLLITCSFIDFEHQILPDEITYILLWLGLVCSCWNLYTYSTRAIIGALVAYLSLFILSFLFKCIRKKEGIGQGDLKLFAAIAAWTGIIYLPLILFLASLSAIIFILFRKVFTGKEFSSPAPFGPFLALSGWLVLLWGNKMTSFLLY